jgi:hypothetical protein
VTVLSPCDAWAVGFDQDTGGLDQTLIEHWDGAAWTVVPSPNVPGLNNELNAVRADSPADIWAAGESFVTGTDQTLILHWDGFHWTRVRSPSLGASDGLNAVAASAASNTWAVGQFIGNISGINQTLALHCC